MIDNFDREILVTELDNSQIRYSVDNFFCDFDSDISITQVLQTFNAMAPANYILN